MTDLDPADAVARAQRPSRRDAVAWARAVEGPVHLGEAEARLVLQEPRLLRAVRVGGEKARAAEEGRAPARRPRSRAPRWPLWATLLLLVHALPVLSLPAGRYYPYADPAAVPGFLLLLGVSCALASLAHLGLFALWLRDPLRARGVRLAASLLTLCALAALLTVVVMAVALVPGSIASPAVIAFVLAVLLAGVNLWAGMSARTGEHVQRAGIQEIRSLLQVDPQPAGGAGDLGDAATQEVRGPVRELRHALRRLPAAEAEDLAAACAEVLDLLERRGNVAPERAARARELPLGRWHEVDEAGPHRG